ncbi:hypothetical protein GOODEAATRI_000685 [Goodea atripinnis]|uniref:C2H2-type domain-containing protein n=1 Tax=Goodea atripinnis TaxID=208336 RepID=A0ABV0N7R5_9TELE
MAETGQGSSSGMDHSHIPEEPSYGGEKGRSNVAEFYEEEDEEDGAYIIEYSNPEEEGESCKFKMLVDRSHPGKKPVIKPLPVREIPKEPLSFRPQRQTCETSQKMKMKTDEENDKNFLELGENFRELMETDSGSAKKLVYPKCPASGKFFKGQAGLARHVRYMHSSEKKKTYFCTSCNQSVRAQIELDPHTRRHQESLLGK